MKDREKNLFRVFWFMVFYSFLVLFLAAQHSSATDINQSAKIPSAIVEEIGEGYTSWEYLHASFIIPVGQIVERARDNLNAAADVTIKFDYHSDHLKGRIELLNATLLSVDIGESS